MNRIVTDPQPPPTRRTFGFEIADWGWVAAFGVLLVVMLYRNFVVGESEPLILALGPVQISTFGLLVALNVLFGYYLVRLWSLRFGLEWETFGDLLVWVVLLGLYLSHLVSVAAYYPADLFDWRVLLDPRSRISSFGGIYGGGLVALYLLRKRGLPLLTYADPLVYGFVGGYIFGRLGCFSVHDHPGRVTEFVLGYPDGAVRRHDLGLYEMFLMIGLFLLITWLARRAQPRPGLIAAVGATIYAPVRFLFDSLRIADVRYLGLTPGQWFAVPMFVIGLAVWVRLLQGSRSDRLVHRDG